MSTMTTSYNLSTTEEVASALRVQASTVRAWVREGRIPVIRPGGKLMRFRIEDVIRAIEAQPSEATTAAPWQERGR
jgi:excisionase family DNA binding protein